MLRKYKSLYSSTCNTFSTGEGVTITPASVTGLPTDTEITLTFDRVDSSGTKTPSKMERIRGTITGGNFVISSGGRAVEGTEQVHTSPVVEMVWNADDWNDTVDHILTEHNQDGTHKDTLVTSLKASGAVVNTGTSDVTIVTPKALADSDYAKTSDITVTPDSTTTLTNKTLTSPKINEDVAVTSTSTEINLLHGKATVMAYADARFKSGVTTRDISTASGNQVITGIGFTPKYVEITACIDGSSKSSRGFYDGTTNASLYSPNYHTAPTTGFYQMNTGGAITMIIDSSNNAVGTVTFQSDGFTIAWTKTGSPTGTAQIAYTCFR